MSGSDSTPSAIYGNRDIGSDLETWIRAWDSWVIDTDDGPGLVPLEGLEVAQVITWILTLGITKMVELIDVTMNRATVRVEDKWRYYCGCVWRAIEQKNAVEPQPRRLTFSDLRP